MNLRRTKGEERLFLGVCGGVAKLFGADPGSVRLLFLVLLLFGGPWIAVIYTVMGLFTPEE